MNCVPYLTLVYFMMIQYSQNFNFPIFAPFNKPCFTKDYKAISLACSSLMCHNHEVQASVSDVYKTIVTSPTTMLPCK